jgi:hypothetical protein
MNQNHLIDPRFPVGRIGIQPVLRLGLPLGFLCLVAIAAIVFTAEPVVGQAKKKEAPTVPLTESGEKLLAKYSEMLKILQGEVTKGLPKIDEEKRAAFLKASQEEMAAYSVHKKALAAAASKGSNDKEASASAVKAAEEGLAKARAQCLEPAKAMLTELEPFLASDSLDTKLVKCAVLARATPRGLAEFAQQGQEQESLVEKLLGDVALMKEMLIAGGAERGRFGQAMQIYGAIQKASPKAREGVFQRLALGTALEHAFPIRQLNTQDMGDLKDNDPTAQERGSVIDPVKRYLHYEKAYLDGELDPAFKNMSAWEYRMIVNSDAPDQMLAWGREMLRNYRPDHILTTNDGWRYSRIVKTDVRYGSQNVKNDVATLHTYQNIIRNGGVCGRRAFFGRFILRSFGIPVWGVTQYKHAAVGRWTPKGWVVNLGATWTWSWWDKDENPRSGGDFLLETQARKAPSDYLKVLRAQWLGEAFGEQHYNDRRHVSGGFWIGVAQYRARAIAAATKAVELPAVGQDVAESNESKEVDPDEKTQAPEKDRKIVIGNKGEITIPAVAFSKSSGGLISMKSFSGGWQMHGNRNFGAEQSFEYTIESPQAGKYTLVARVVTVQSEQKLLLQPNGTEAAVEIALPYTLGRWDQTTPVEITLNKGQNVLRFTRPAPTYGVTIKEFTLTPVK